MFPFLPPAYYQKSQVYQGPAYILADRVVRSILDESLAHPPTETGQALLGVRTPTAVYGLAVVPDLLDTIRRLGFFKQGGTDQGEIFFWINKHWEAMRDASRGKNASTIWTPNQLVTAGNIPAELDLPLLHIGDWHKHPGNMNHLSSIDTSTIQGLFRDSELEMKEFFAPLVTTSSPGFVPMVHKFVGSQLRVDMNSQINIDFFYLRKDDDTIWQVKPTIVPDQNLPWMPPLPWYLSDLERMRRELDALDQGGYKHRWTIKQMNSSPEMEIVFAVDHPKWTTHRAIIITDWNYPTRRPEVKKLVKGEAAVTPQAQPAPQPTKPNQPVRNFFHMFEDWVGWIFGGDQYTEDIYASQPPLVTQKRSFSSERLLVDIIHEMEERGEFYDKQTVGPESSGTRPGGA